MSCGSETAAFGTKGSLLLLLEIGFDIDDVKQEADGIYVTAKEGSLNLSPNANIQKPDKAMIFETTAYFQQSAVLFKKTAITESAALACANKLVVHSEDLSQETALYKLIGRNFFHENKYSYSELSLLISAKLDLSLIKKIALLGLGLVISRTAPTKQALDFAADYNISVVGFARGKRFNWYLT